MVAGAVRLATKKGSGCRQPGRMPCDSCGALVVRERIGRLAIRAGQYIHADPDNPHRSFHVPGPGACLPRSALDGRTRGSSAWRDAQIEGAWEKYKLFVNERQAEPWTDEHEGLSARKMMRATYSLGSRGKDDLGELDRRVLLLTAGTDAGAHGLYTEFVAWGIQPATGQVICWGLQYRITGGTPTDDLDTPEMWGAYFRLLENRRLGGTQAFPGVRMGLHQVLVDSGGEFSARRAELGSKRNMIRTWAHAVPKCGIPTGRWCCRASARARDGRRALGRPVAGKPTADARPASALARTGRASTPDWLKDTVYATGAAGPAAAGRRADLQMIWPVDLEARGYTEAYFREYGNEVRHSKFTPKGGWGTHWDQRIGKAKMNEAWDCRIYATGGGADALRATGQHGPPDRVSCGARSGRASITITAGPRTRWRTCASIWTFSALRTTLPAVKT